MKDDIFIFDMTGTLLKGVKDKSIKSAVIPEGVTRINLGAFYDCKSLKSIDLPEGLQEIGDGAFVGCKSLTSITVDEGNSVYFSKDDVLYRRLDNGKNELVRYPEGKSGKSFTVGADTEIIGAHAFSGCESLESVELPEGVSEIGEYAFSWCKSLKSINLPKSVTEIGTGTFCACESLESIALPRGLTEIDKDAFWGCMNLGSITVDDRNTVYFTKDGVLYRRLDNGKNELVRYPQGKTEKSFTVADTEIIGDRAFEDCESLESIDLQKGVTKIGENAFDSCISLKSINLPTGLTEIDSYAFDYCTDLENIYSAIRDLENIKVWDNDFADVDKDKCILFVPDGTQEAYRHHPVFGKFKNIEME